MIMEQTDLLAKVLQLLINLVGIQYYIFPNYST